MNIKIIVILFSAILHCSLGFYIKRNNDVKLSSKNGIKAPQKDEWSIFQQKLGLTPKNVELLRSQKDQHATKEMIRQYIKENNKYMTVVPFEKKQKTKEEIQEDQFNKIYENFVENLKMSKGSTIKTSLHFELADEFQNELQRPRRKIAVKMVSDMPSKRVDDMLKIFYEQHGINSHVNYLNTDADVDAYADEDENDSDYEYGESDMSLSTIQEPDYDYDSLYEDEQDSVLTAQSRQNSQDGSFQDLIMQAKRNQWERENEERKLHFSNYEHFV